MYDDPAITVNDNIISKSPYARMVCTSELVPERCPNGQLSRQLTPKQDHLVHFFGGFLMLSATITVDFVSPLLIPPRPTEFVEHVKRDWKDGVELVKTCMHMHDS
ncbi:hypothetical protein GYMLUDRAFT_101804, partial [Collybiopsis luxurians FD-317 M1]